jgi:hypothetical protein
MVSNEQPDNVIAFGGNTMVYESVKRFALKGLSDLIRVLMENIDDALFELSEKVESDRERNMYFDAMREIRLKRKQIQQNFDTEMQQCFDYLLLERLNPKNKLQEEELSLVEQEDIEGQLAIENMISKARPHFEDDLYAIIERLKVVLHRKQIPEDLNPLDPKAICESFHLACKDLDSDIHVLLIFYKMFDKFVMSRLGGFYVELNNYFVNKGVLPEFEASKERMKFSSRFMSNKISKGDPSYQSNEESSASSDPVDKRGNIPALDGNVLSMLQQAFSPSPGAYSTGEMPAVSGQHGGSSGASGVLPDGGGSSVLIHPEYAAALSGLQTVMRSNQPVYNIDPNQYKTELQQQLNTFKQQNSHLSTSSDNQIIDIISMLFDFFFDDEALPDPIKVLIGRLQIPILKVAMLDENFFNQKKHPARKLLDSISKASLGWSADTEQEQILIDKIEKIVDFLLTEFEQDVSVFETALNEFKEFMSSENTKVANKLQEIKRKEQEKDEQLQRAQTVVSSFIQKMLNKHKLGLTVIEFLEGTWTTVLSNTLASQGADSKHWQNLKQITTTLIWTLIPKHSEEDKNKLLKTLPSLLRALSRGMELVKTDIEDQNKVFKMLVLEHSRVVKQTSKNIVTRIDDKTVWPEGGPETAFAGFSEIDDQDEVVDIQFSKDDTGEIQIVENDLDASQESELITNVAAIPTQQVVHNLEEFAESVNQGNITIDEEIILDTAASQYQASPYEQEQDESDHKARSIEIGDWIEFIEHGSKAVNAKLSWKSNVTGKYVFVNRHGVKIKNITVNGLAMEIRAGRAKIIESVSVFDRAISSFMSTIKH